MALNMKILDTLGMVTLVTPPSMINPEKIGFTLINLKEKEKDQFAKHLNKIYPNENIVVYICRKNIEKVWLSQAIRKSTYVIVDKTDLPIWIDEALPIKKCYEVTAERSIEETFKIFNTEANN
tara:strand:+ start:122 stop:490 length:369 start_codon:yes stop_codon:yes gene_type:complete